MGGPFKGLNKWEGGVMSADGKMMCMPLNHKAVLEIDPCRGGAVRVLPTGGSASTAGMSHD